MIFFRMMCLASVSMMLVILCFASPVLSQLSTPMLRCGSDIVQMGDSMYLVKDRCGQPAETQHMDAVLGGGTYGGTRTQNLTPTTVMIYNCGSTDFIYKLIFTGDILTSIQAITRGSGPGTCK